MTYDKFGFPVVVITHPVMPTLRLTNIDDHTEHLRLAFAKNRGWRSIITDKGTLASSTKILDLAQYGLAVNSENAKQVIKYLADIEARNYNDIPEQLSVGRCGWIDDNRFAPYCDTLVFDGDAAFQRQFDAVSSKGSYDQWLTCARAQRGNSELVRIMLAASFASVLVAKCNALSFFVHLWGGSGKGKTVALMLAASVWGKPEIGDYVITYNTTQFAMTKCAAFFNSLPLCVDDTKMQIGKKDGFDKDIYLLAEGMVKMQGTRAGGIKRPETWRNCILSTGETPITSNQSSTGAMMRVIELSYGNDDLFTDPRGVVSVISANYGYAGRDFVHRLMEDDHLRAVRTDQEDYYAQLIARGIEGKQALSASILLAADRWSEQWIFADGLVLPIDALVSHLKTTTELDQNARCYDWLMDYVSSNAFRFHPDDGGNVECWGRREGKYVYIVKSVFDRALTENGYSPEAFLQWAKRCGKLKHGNGRLTLNTRINGSVARCVVLDTARTEGGFEDAEDVSVKDAQIIDDLFGHIAQ